MRRPVPRYLYHKSRVTDRPLITEGILIRRSRAERPLRNPKSLPPQAGEGQDGGKQAVCPHTIHPHLNLPPRGGRGSASRRMSYAKVSADGSPRPYPLDSCLRPLRNSGPVPARPPGLRRAASPAPDLRLCERGCRPEPGPGRRPGACRSHRSAGTAGSRPGAAR